MTENIWVAIIGAVGAIIAAIVGIFKKKDKSESKSDSSVSQTFNVSGDHNTVVGIRNDKKEK